MHRRSFFAFPLLPFLNRGETPTGDGAVKGAAVNNPRFVPVRCLLSGVPLYVDRSRVAAVEAKPLSKTRFYRDDDGVGLEDKLPAGTHKDLCKEILIVLDGSRSLTAIVWREDAPRILNALTSDPATGQSLVMA